MEHGRQVAVKALAVAAGVTHLHPDLKFIERPAWRMTSESTSPTVPSWTATAANLYPPWGSRPRNHGCAGLSPATASSASAMSASASALKTSAASASPAGSRPFAPLSLEEQIICYADKFFRKTAAERPARRPSPEIVENLSGYGADKVERFMGWVERFE